jgi:hypothetical protein
VEGVGDPNLSWIGWISCRQRPWRRPWSSWRRSSCG